MNKTIPIALLAVPLLASCNDKELRATVNKMSTSFNSDGSAEAAVTTRTVASRAESTTDPEQLELINGNSMVLNDQYFHRFRYLAFPQTRADMISAFGYPSRADQTTDYYRFELKNGDQGWVAIHYNTQGQATGFRTYYGASQEAAQ